MLYGNSLLHWVYAVMAAGTVAIVLWIIRLTGRRVAPKLSYAPARPIKTVLAAASRSTSYLFIAAAALFAGSRMLQVSSDAGNWIRALSVIALLIQIGLWINGYLTMVVHRYENRHLENEAGKVTTFRALVFVGRIIIFSLVLLLALDYIPGIEVSALIASLGVGGIAVALAVQNILADLFASLSISLDKPFAIGDFIIVDEFLGTVEHIGLKTTRIRSLSGEQLIFANNDLLKSRIRNYKRMEQRRVAFTVGVTYQTSLEKLRKVPAIFRALLEQQEDVHFDRAHFKEYGPYSLNFEFVYYIHSPDYNRYMDVQQALNLGLYESFEAEGIEFAYPTQTLFLNEETGSSAV